MTISRAKLEEIRQDEDNLNRFIELLEQGYSFLSAKCEHALGGIQDEEPEDDEEEETEPEFDIAEPNLTRKDIVLRKAEDLTAFDRDDNEYFETEEVVLDPDGENEPVKKVKHKEVDIKELYRMIKQLSHPDKLMKYSAEQKQQIIAIFHESTEFMDDDNLEALVFSYVKLRIARNEPHKIPDYIEAYVRERHKQILRHGAFLMQKPFTPAILEWRDGNVAYAVILFRRYLIEKKKEEMRAKAAAEDDDEFFS
jgi:hypothetical protein